MRFSIRYWALFLAALMTALFLLAACGDGNGGAPTATEEVTALPATEEAETPAVTEEATAPPATEEAETPVATAEATAPPATEEAETPMPGEDAMVPGVTDDEIVLGTHTALTGPVAVYAQIAGAMKAYFDYVNDTKGGVNGRTIKLIIEDDAYSPPKTVELVRKLVEQDQIFALVNGFGTPTHLQVVDYLQERGVPDLFVATGAIEWVKDPEARPTVFGSIPNYVAEGVILGQYIAETYPGQKLGLMRQNDDFGVDGMEGIRRGVGDALEIVGEEIHEVLDVDLSSQVDRLRASGADVIAIWATPNHFASAVKHARLNLNWDVPFVLSIVSSNELTVLLSGPEVMEGTVSLAYLASPYELENPNVAKHHQLVIESMGVEGGNTLTLYGQYIGELVEEALNRAGRDLTREGLIEAVESISDFWCSICLGPVNMSPTDHDPLQGAFLVRAEGGRWVRFGGLISYEGVLPGDMTVEDLEK